MKKLASSPWDYDLVETKGRLVLVVMTGGSAAYEIASELLPEEVQAWEARGIEGIQALITGMRDTPSKYKGRQCPLPEGF